MPEMASSQFLEMTAVDKAHENLELRKGTLEDLFQRAAFRHFMARVKRMALETQDRFFSGIGMPKGLEAASPREAYFTGLVNASRTLLELQRQIWDEACERDEEEPDRLEKPEPEENPFGPDPITQLSR